MAREAEQERYRLEAEKKEQEDKAKVAEARQAITERRNQLLTIGVAYDVAKDGYFILPEATERVELTGSQLLLKDDKEWEKTLESVKKEVEINKKALAKKLVLVANQKARVVRFRLEAEKKAAEHAKINAENRAIEVAKRAKEEKEHAKNRAKAVQEEGIRLERARVQAERQKEIDKAKAREADVKHRTKINNEALEAIKGILEEGYAGEEKYIPILIHTMITKNILNAIAKGKIPNIFIKY